MRFTITLEDSELRFVRRVLIWLGFKPLLRWWRELEKTHWRTRKTGWEKPDFQWDSLRIRRLPRHMVIVMNRTAYKLFYKPLIWVASYVKGFLFITAILMASLVRFSWLDEFATSFDHGLKRVCNDVEELIERRARRKEEKMYGKTNAAVKVAEVKFTEITSFMCQSDCSDEERWALQELMETDNIGAANAVGLDIKYQHNRAFVARSKDLPVVYHGQLVA